MNKKKFKFYALKGFFLVKISLETRVVVFESTLIVLAQFFEISLPKTLLNLAFTKKYRNILYVFCDKNYFESISIVYESSLVAVDPSFH